MAASAFRSSLTSSFSSGRDIADKALSTRLLASVESYVRVCPGGARRYVAPRTARYRYADAGGLPQYSFCVVPRSLCWASNV